nr:MAG: putative RNA-dependent RNA polymerase [Narnaviridae sp.]
MKTNDLPLSFEKHFFTKTFYLGSGDYDYVLKNLIKVINVSKSERYLETNYSILVDINNFKRQIKSLGRPELERKLYKIRNEKNFSYSEFCKVNGVPVQTLLGRYPLIFENLTLVKHSLKLTEAFITTLKLQQMFDFNFTQRMNSNDFVKKSQNKFCQIFSHFYFNFLKLKLSEKDLIKCIKNSLCYHLALAAQQTEFPEGVRINLIPQQFNMFFKTLSPLKRLEFFFSLNQSKSMCQVVPDTFIQGALEEHREKLSSEHPGVSTQSLKELRERGREFGKIVKRFYNPHKGYLPTGKATFGFPRNKGGVKGDLVFNNIVKTKESLNRSNQRQEPIVIGFFGQPGSGKSSRIGELLVFLQQKFFPKLSFNEDDLVYSRSCSVEHWDGYKGQPITILDDLGQSREGNDIKEFQTLVSSNPYVLPMADLREKGTYFESSIIILTTNLVFGSDLSLVYEKNCGIIDDLSFWRRITVPIYSEQKQLCLLKNKPNFVRKHALILNSSRMSCEARDHFSNPSQFYTRETQVFSEIGSDGRYHQGIWDKKEVKFIFEFIEKEILFRSYYFQNNISTQWIQTIRDSRDSSESMIPELFVNQYLIPSIEEGDPFNFIDLECRSKGERITGNLDFPSFPPEGPLPVRIEPIVEPLKVRTITAGIGQTFCLKPFQVAMSKALGCEKQFSLTRGKPLNDNIKRIYDQSGPDDVWISGDYTAATDSVSIEATKALLDGILESIDHEPTRRWAMKEISPHLLTYPKSSGLEPVLQKSGQLMGSLLSFPLLCLLNDCTARSIGLKPEQYLINGDDILMRCPVERYETWKMKVQDFGLKLSLGKNYIHKSFGTVNSQLIFEDKILSSGKHKVVDRRNVPLGETFRDFQLMYPHLSVAETSSIFKELNKEILSKSIRSLSVPFTHGGLSSKWGPFKSEKDRYFSSVIYVHDLLNKIKPSNKINLCIPYLSKNKCSFEMDSKMFSKTFQEPVANEEFFEEFIGIKDILRSKKRMLNSQILRDFVHKTKLEDLPSLNFIQKFEFPLKVSKEKLSDLQNIVDNAFFKMFFEERISFSYENYMNFLRKEFKNEENLENKFLNLFELIRGDFLHELDFSYKCNEFDSKTFKENLKLTEFLPKSIKELDLFLENSDYLDYSKEIQEFQKFLICDLNNPFSCDSQELFDFQDCFDQLFLSSFNDGSYNCIL